MKSLPFEEIPSLAPCLAGFTGRQGGVSDGSYGTLNLGSNTDDSMEKVRGNRAILERAAGRRIVYMRQVHGSKVLPASRTTPDGMECDALVTSDPSIAVAVLTADCLPLLLSCDGGHVCAAVHCGWRGAVAGIAARTVEAMRSIAGNDAGFKAFIGPCIRQESFEVGPEVLEAALSSLGNSDEVRGCFAPGRDDRLMCSIPDLVMLSLRQAGVDPSCIADCRIDTYRERATRYSWRVSRDTGREACFIGPAA